MSFFLRLYALFCNTVPSRASPTLLSHVAVSFIQVCVQYAFTVTLLHFAAVTERVHEDHSE